MKLFHETSLERGRALIDFAYAHGATPTSFKLADLVCIAAAYIATGNPTCEMRQQLSATLGDGIARDVYRTFEMFDDNSGRGLWTQGPASEDIRYTNKRLARCYPAVERRWRDLFQDDSAPSIDTDVPF